MDALDRKILRILQADATATIGEISRAVGLSATPCWKRIQKLEAMGVIHKRVVILAPEKLGLSVSVQMNIETGDHSREAIDAFVEAVCEIPEVMQFQRLAGDLDFSLRVVAVDVKHYERVHRRIVSLMPLRRVSSYFELQQLKSETALPLSFATEAPGRAEPAAVEKQSRQLGQATI